MPLGIKNPFEHNPLDHPGEFFGDVKKDLGVVKKQALRPIEWEDEHWGRPLAAGFRHFQGDIDALPNPFLRNAARVAFGIGAATTLGTLGFVATGGNPLGALAGVGTGAALAHPKSSGAASSLLLPSSLIGFGMPGAAVKSLGMGLRGISLLEEGGMAARGLESLSLGLKAGRASELGRTAMAIEKLGTRMMEAEQKAVSGAMKAAAYPVYKPFQMLWKLGGVIPRSGPAMADQLAGEARGLWIMATGDTGTLRPSELPKLMSNLIYRVNSGGELTKGESQLVALMHSMNSARPNGWQEGLKTLGGAGTSRKAQDMLVRMVARSPDAAKDVLAAPKLQATWEMLTKPMRGVADEYVNKFVPIITLPSKAMLEFPGYADANLAESLLQMFQLPPGASNLGTFFEQFREAHSFGIPGLKSSKKPATKKLVSMWKDIPGVPATVSNVNTNAKDLVIPEMGFGKGFFRGMQGALTRAIDLLTFNKVAPYEIVKRLPESYRFDAIGEVPSLFNEELQWRVLHAAANGNSRQVLKFLESVNERGLEQQMKSKAKGLIYLKHPMLPTDARNILDHAEAADWAVDPQSLVNQVTKSLRKHWQSVRASEPHMIATQFQGLAQEAQAAIDAGVQLTPQELENLWTRWKATETLAGAAAENADKAIIEQARGLPGKTHGERRLRTDYFTAAHTHMMNGLDQMDLARNDGLRVLLNLPGAAEAGGAARLADMNTAWDAVRQSWAEWKLAKDEFFAPGGRFFGLRKSDNEAFWQAYNEGMLGSWEKWRNTAMPIYNQILAEAGAGDMAALQAGLQQLPGVAGAMGQQPLVRSLLNEKMERSIADITNDIQSLFTTNPRMVQMAEADRQTIRRLAAIADSVSPEDKKQAAEAFAYGVKKAADKSHMISIDSSNLTIADSFFRAIGLPFFSYEARRFPRMAELVLERPAIARNLYKFFTDASDEGYVRLPGTPMDVSLFRMLGLGPLRSMQQPYWEPEHDGFIGMMERAQSSMSKFGFFPMSMQMFTAIGTGNPSELLPPALESAAAAVELIPKGSPILGGVKMAEILPSFFNTDTRQAYLKAQLIDMGIDPSLATEEDKDAALKSVNLAILASAGLGVTRFKPELLRKITDARGAAAAQYGIPQETITRALKSGRNPIYAADESGMPYLNKVQQEKATDEVAAKLGIPPEAVRAVSDIWVQIRPEKEQSISGYYDQLSRFDAVGEAEQLAKPAQAVMKGDALPYEWRDARTKYYTYRDLVKRKLLAENNLTDGDLKFSPESPKRPEDVLAEQYFDMDPDTDGNGIVSKAEWDVYDKKTSDFLAKCTPAERDYIRNYRDIPWKDQNNINLESRLRKSKVTVQALFATPKYTGIPVETQKKIDEVNDMEDDFYYQIRQQNRLSTAQIPNNDAVWAAFSNYLASSNPAMVPYLVLATKLRVKKVRDVLRNPERLNILMRNPDVLAFYPDLARALSEDERLILGIGSGAAGEEGILQAWASRVRTGRAT